jgi:2,4-dienoyl-CoA reductase-like NADH-dependent reductase (Old Yellow Enzyme family)
MSHLFSTLKLRAVEFRNRIFVSPMCQYSAENGMPGDWHFVHLGSRAVGGAALVMVEATAVSPEGRISPFDTGMWSDAHIDRFRRITAFVRAQGAVPGIQLAHAGRKASTDAPWRGGRPLDERQGGWPVLAPTPMPFASGYPAPREMSHADIAMVVDEFGEAARRSVEAGFDVVEVHSAHGYLLHQFLSPLSNHRMDEYGASFANRTRFPLAVVERVRTVWPAGKPVFVRVSATDWAPGGWDVFDSIQLARALKTIGVDLVDCSSGGLVPDAKVPAAPGYQTPFAASIRREAEIATAAVGLITDPTQAEQIIATEQADAIFLARELLRNPYWPLRAAHKLKAEVRWPVQYERAKPR